MKLFSIFTNWLKNPVAVAPDFKWSHILAKFDFNLLVYLDDILFVSYMSPRRTRQLIRLLRFLFQLFGLTIHPDKSVLSPC